jgi:hypothetical protein
MEQGIALKIITFPTTWEGNPLPYAPAFFTWTEHAESCAQCGRVDQLARQGQAFNPAALCEVGDRLQFTVGSRIEEQHWASLLN